MLLALILALSLGDPAGASITGVVKDTAGGAVVGASVVVKSVSGTEQTVTGPDGRFSIDNVPSGSATITVKAGGFAEKEEPLTGSPTIEVVLAPAALLENVTVTASRGEEKTGNVSASINVIDQDTVRQSPAVVVDDVLRQMPQFSLFTRASSLSSHPTSQGVSLRGIGPSGVSRTLVMTDGIPENDPFGGWVYWTRVPLESVDRIEIVDGPSSSLYGNYAMGGVINVLTTHPQRATIDAKGQYGNLNTPKVDYFGSDVWGKLGVAVEGSSFDTNGFPIVAVAERGPIDNNVTDKYNNVNLKLDYSPTSRVNTFLRTGYFKENRNNGKASSTDPLGTEEANDTTWKFVSGGAHLLLAGSNMLQVSGFTNSETFHSNFLAVPTATPARSIARATLNQTVPSKDAGGMLQWSRGFGTMNVVTAGGDFHWVTGESQEDGLDAVTGTNVNLYRASGGTQKSYGGYVQDNFTPLSRLTITVAARIDYFDNYNAHNLENNVSCPGNALANSCAIGTPIVLGTATANNFPSLPGQTETVATPRVGAVYHLTDRINLWGDFNTGFRAPTLNELYRQFKKGTTTTLPNYTLVPERLTGGEGGVSVEVTRSLTARVTLFGNSIRNPVTNVTMTSALVPIPSTGAVPANAFPTTASCTPSAAVICVLRQNVGRTEIDGVQTDVTFRWKDLRFTAAYLHNSATVKEDAANPNIVGNFLAEVPQNRGSAQISYANAKIATIAFGYQAVGAQFDDDVNTPSRLMPSYVTADLSASRNIVKGVDVFFGMQNMFNETYVVATLPTTIGSPRLYNGGVRIRWSGR
jgi:iron complex outermembrane receptor protein